MERFCTSEHFFVSHVQATFGCHLFNASIRTSSCDLGTSIETTIPRTKMIGEIQKKSLPNHGIRQQRSVQLDEVRDNSLRSSESGSFSSQFHRRRRRRGDRPSSGKNSKGSFLGSPHSRSTEDSIPSISIEELKSMLNKKKVSGGIAPKTHLNPSERLTIGDSSNLGSSRKSAPLSTSLHSDSTHSASLPDLFSLEQTLNEYGEEELKEEIQRIASHQEQGKKRDKKRNRRYKTPVTWKTPFEVDAPRLAPRIDRYPSSDSICSNPEPDPLFSEEQDAWAGIDELLENKSVDGSSAFSTSEILPRETVKAMRRDFSLRFLEEDFENERDNIERETKRSSNSLHKTTANGTKYLVKPSSDDSADSEDGDRDRELLLDIKRRQLQGRVQGEQRKPRGQTSGRNLFDVFHWSEKDNVDNLRSRNHKLNRNPRKAKPLTGSMHRSGHSTRRSHHRNNSLHKSNHTLASSMPSLKSFEDDDLSGVTSHTDWDTFHSKEFGSIVSGNSREEFGGDEDFEYEEYSKEIDTDSEGRSTSASLVGDGLVLDKGVDEYIRRIEKQLPTIAEGNAGPLVLHNFDETSESPTSVTDSSALDDLPSLNDLSNCKRTSSKAQTESSPKKVGEKKAPKPSLSSQLLQSIEKMKKKGKSKKVGHRDEEKYFPDAVKPDKAKALKENICLLSGVDE